MSCYYVVMLVSFSRVIIVNNASSYVIKLHGQYVSFSAFFLRSWCGLKPSMIFPKGEGSVTSLMKIPRNKS